MALGSRRLGDRRVRPRFEIVGQLWGSLEAVQPLSLRNLGRDGALVESTLALPVDTVQRLSLAFDTVVCDVQARVCHVRPSRPDAADESYLVGLEFLGLPAAARQHIDRLVGAAA